MATTETLKRWLDLLIEQTNYGNVQWVERRKHNAYTYVATESAVYLETRDNDGQLPYVLSVADGDGNIEDQWIVYGEGASDIGDAAPEWMSTRVRDLWEMLKGQFSTDPVAKMLAELEAMPPF